MLAVEAGLDGHGTFGEVGAWQGAEQEALRAEGVAVQVLRAFPAYPSVAGVVSLDGFGPGQRLRAGVTVGYGSTGGRLAYADYSGTLDVDCVAERTFVGVRLGGTSAVAGPIDIGLSLEGRYNRSTLTYRRTAMLGDRIVEDVRYEAEAAPLSMVGAVQAEVAVAGPLRLHLRVGAEGSATDDLDGAGADDVPRGVGLRWSGLRGSLGVAVRL